MLMGNTNKSGTTDAKNHRGEWNEMRLGSHILRDSHNTLLPDIVEYRDRGNSKKAEPGVQFYEVKDL